MISAFAEHRHDGVHQDPGRADNQSEAMSQFHPSFSGAASSRRPSWAIADDIFWERYGTALRVTEGSWRALPHLKALSGQLHATAGNISTSFQVPSEDVFDGPSSAIDPWLLYPSSTGDSPSLGGGAGQLPAGASASHHHLLFQYKPYSQQEPLHLSEQDVAAVLEVAFGKVPYGAPNDENTDTIAPAGGSQTFSLPHPHRSLCGGAGGSTVGGGAGMNQSPSDVACVVLVKLIMDLYLAQGPQLTFSMVHFMLQRALLNGDGTARARIFDLIMNLAVHGELLYDAPGDQVPEDDAAVVEAVAKLDRAGPSADWRHTVTSALRASLAVGLETPTSAAAATGRGSGGNPGFGNPSGSSDGTNAGFHQQNSAKEEEEEIDGGEWPPLPRPSPIDTCHGIDPRGQRFRQWLRLLLFRMLSVLCSVPTNSSSSEAAWAAAASCLAVLSTHEGQVVRSFVQEMPLEAAAALLQQSKEQEWPHSLRCWIGCLAVNLMYARSGTNKKQNSTTTAGGNGSGDSGGGNSGGKSGMSGEVLFSLDASRLKAFGGILAVIRNYLDAPTLKCRRAFFCVMFDYLANDGGSGGRDDGGGGTAEAEIDVDVESALSQARSLLHAVHSSQKDALGAALLYTRAAEALCLIFKLSFGSYNSGNNSGSGNSLSHDLIYDVAADITAQIASVHASYPEQVMQPPPGVVEQSLRALLAMVSAAGAPAAAPTAAGGSARDEENELEKLCTALKEGSIRAETDLLRMLMEFADKELAASASAGRQSSGGLLPRFPSPPAAGGGGKITSLAIVLEQSLPDIRGHAASAFIRAVHALLDYVQLATAGLAATSWQRIDFPSVALQTISVAIEWLNLAPPGARQRALAAAAERAVAVLTVRKIDPILSSMEVANSNTIGNTTGIVLSGTISNSNNVVHQGGVNSASGRVVAAREDLSQQQQQQQPALEPPLRPQQQFNDFSVVGASNIDHLAGGHKPSSPLSKIMPVPKLTAAWRRLTNPHHGGGGGGGASGGGLSPTSIDARQQQQAGNTGVNEQVRPLSAGLSSLSGAEREAASISTAAPSSLPPRSPAVSQQQQQQQQPVYQAHRSRQFSSDVSLLSLAAERALYERHAAAEAEHGCAEAVAAAETKLTSIDSFLSGLSEVVPGILSQVPIEMLQSLMEGLKPEILWTSSSMSVCGGGGGGGVSIQARTESQSRVSAVQAGRPLWDARAAVAILLLRQVNRDTPSSTSTARDSRLEISFIASLLSDSDPRVRRHASTFILSRFSQRKAQQYRIAVREVVARAQQGDDDGLLKSAEAQVKAMLEARLMNLEGLV